MIIKKLLRNSLNHKVNQIYRNILNNKQVMEILKLMEKGLYQLQIISIYNLIIMNKIINYFLNF